MRCELRRSLARLKNAGLRDDAADEGYFEMAHTSLQVTPLTKRYDWPDVASCDATICHLPLRFITTSIYT
jgi:hypothetical protein